MRDSVAADVPDPETTYSDRSEATDLDTDHTFKLSPERLAWQIQRSGIIGDIDHYVGVFWWAQRVRVEGTFPSATITFGETWADGDTVFITIGGTAIGKSVFPANTVDTIAAHFAWFINETFVGVGCGGRAHDCMPVARVRVHAARSHRDQLRRNCRENRPLDGGVRRLGDRRGRYAGTEQGDARSSVELVGNRLA